MRAADMHCDTIYEIYEGYKRGESVSLRNNSLHLDLEKMKKGDYGIQNFAVYVNLKKTENPFLEAMEMIDIFYQEMKANEDLIHVVKSYEDIEKNWREEKMSAMLTLEEGGVCLGNTRLLRDFYRLGVRMMTLTWNYPNELACPNRIVTEGPDKGCYPDTEHGLTQKGMEFLEEMEDLGMIIDISHLNDAGIWDVFAHTRKPFVASHSNARALASHPRNLTDEMIRALGERGGVAGINYCPAFLHDWADGETKKSMIAHMTGHMKHMKQVGGIGCIGLGSDFDGIVGELELAHGGKLPMLEAEMKRQGFLPSEIEAIFYGNVMRVYRDVLS
ncbi:MAG: membrane dipeptidase [Hungatella sp.]|jgi:membrane dipeptidase|nr:membrane dipeptidase [Hungatella sp.]